MAVWVVYSIQVTCSAKSRLRKKALKFGKNLKLSPHPLPPLVVARLKHVLVALGCKNKQLDDDTYAGGND